MVSWLHRLLHRIGLQRFTPYLCKVGLHRFAFIYLEADSGKRAFGHCAACDQYVNF